MNIFDDREVAATTALHGLTIEVTRFEKWLTLSDIDYFDEAIAHYVDLIRTGVFNRRNARKLRGEDWHRFNRRHGATSIKGVAGEVVAAGLWNMKTEGSGTLMSQAPPIKAFELAGRDLTVSNPGWTNDYYAQVKVVRTNAKGKVQLRDRVCKYDPEDVDRIILVDFEHKKALYGAYPSLHRYFGANRQRTFTWQELASVIYKSDIKSYA